MGKGLKILLPLLSLVIIIGGLWVAKDRLQGQPQPKPTESSPSKIVLAISFVKANQMPIIVASEKGFFKKYNLDVEIKQVEKNVTQVIASGNADVTLSTPNISLAAVVAGSPLSWIGSVNSDQATVLVSIKDPKNIKTVGVISGPARAQTLGMLTLLGINPENLTIQEVSDNQARLRAIQTKQVDAIHVPKPDWLIFKKQANLSDEYKILLDSSTNPKAYMPIGITVRNDFLKSNKQTVENLAKALLEADFWILNNKDEFITLAQKSFSDMPADDAQIQAESYLGTLSSLQFTPTLEKAEQMLDLVKVNNLAAGDYNVENFMSLTIADSLTESGFLAQLGFK